MLERRSLLIVGPAGIGKSHVAGQIAERRRSAGAHAPTVSASASARTMPLGAFLGVLPALEGSDGLAPAAAAIDAYGRRRSNSWLVVDDVHHLDDASLLVVRQLIASTGIPAVLTARRIDTLPPGIRELYDAGSLGCVELIGLDDPAAGSLLAEQLDGPITPRAERTIVDAAGGNPLHLREIVAGSLVDRRLQRRDHGWDLVGQPASTPRLTDLIGERFRHLDEELLEEAVTIGAAGGLPLEVVDDDLWWELSRAGIVVRRDGWVALAHPLYAEVLRSFVEPAHRDELARAAVRRLGRCSPEGFEVDGRDVRRRRTALALDLGTEIEPADARALARHALTTFDELTARRAAEAALAVDATDGEAHRLAGLACSAAGDLAAAEEHLAAAHDHADDDTALAAAALALAHHRGVARHRPADALRTIESASATVIEPGPSAQLARAALRWATVAGATVAHPPASTGASDHIDDADDLGLAVLAMSAVITGPLADAAPVLRLLQGAPDRDRSGSPLVPLLTDLAGAMAISASGDVIATRDHLERHLAEAPPEQAGTWEYALGVTEFFAADGRRAAELAERSVAHLRWRDPAGLLPAALGLAAATAAARGDGVRSRRALEHVPQHAAADPKVTMFDWWIQAWTLHGERQSIRAAEVLLEASDHLLELQHTYFAGTLAHEAIRAGGPPGPAADRIREAEAIAGGGLLGVLLDHAEAMAAKDRPALARVASELADLGMVASAVDTWRHLGAIGGDPTRALEARRHLLEADRHRSSMPGLVSWSAPRSSDLILTDREYAVARLAARRYTAREIAEANGVSPNTVTNQLHAAFRKLGVSNRAELRAVMGES